MRARIIVPIASAIVIVIVIATALATGMGGAAGADQPQVLRFLAVNEDVTSTDAVDQSAPPRLGARVIWRIGLYNWAGRRRGARAGRVVAFCTYVGRSPEQAYCDAGAFLSGGQLLVSAFYAYGEGEGPTRVSIRGGTGVYADARGSLRSTSIGPEELGRSALEFHLSP